jgi:RNA polymerase sigma factor (sigma-70 family)
MDTSSLDTAQMHSWLDRMRSGDGEAATDLFRKAGARLERLARKMLRDFPRVRSCTETADIVQNAVIRLLRALTVVRPACTRAFYALAAEQMRRELIDLARRCHGVHGPACGSVDSLSEEEDTDTVEAIDEIAAHLNGEQEEDLEQWAQFHEMVARLPVEEREVVGLIFYHGWDQARVAELLHTTDRTVRRRWASAMEKLRTALKN